MMIISRLQTSVSKPSSPNESLHKRSGASICVKSSSWSKQQQQQQHHQQQQTGSASAAASNVVAARLMDMGKKLLDAARDGQVDDVRQLVMHSGAPFTSDWLGTTALHLAAQNGHVEITEILLKGGVNRDARTKLERTALHLAAQGGSVDVVDLLLTHGSDINARDMLKMTPLHWAVERGHVCVVEKLLFSGADVSVKSKFQLTPIDIARNSESYQLIELFKVRQATSSIIELLSLDDMFLTAHQTWTNKQQETNLVLDYSSNLNSSASFNESLKILDVDFHATPQLDNDEMTPSPPNRQLPNMSDTDEPCIDLVELEWSTLKFEPDFFLANDDEDEPKVEYLMKIVEELQKENRLLRKRVEQLSATCK